MHYKIKAAVCIALSAVIVFFSTDISVSASALKDESEAGSPNVGELPLVTIDKENILEKYEESNRIRIPVYIPRFSAEDINNLTCLVYEEAGNQSDDGKISIAAVVLNRKRDTGDFADKNTISEVIFAKSAFANIEDTDLSVAKEKGCYDAAMKAVDGEDPTEQLLWEEAERLGLDPEVYAAGGALYFYNPEFCSDEELAKRANIKCKIQIGDHIFYKVWDQ